ncbi:MAG: hypothetical protein ACYDA3_11340 [Gaiellaceae bacterium]
MVLRLSLILVPALAVAGLDLAVKAAVTTTAWNFHQRSYTWSVIAVVFLVVLLALAVLPSRLVATAAGVVAGGVLGDVVSARLHGGSVPNPLVLGDVALNPADVFVLAGLPVLTFALARVAIAHRDLIDRRIPPRRWELALRRRLGL